MQPELKLQRAGYITRVMEILILVSFLHLIYPQPANYLRTLPFFSKSGTLSRSNGPHLVPTEMSVPGSLVRTASNSAIGINDIRHRRRSRSTSIIHEVLPETVIDESDQSALPNWNSSWVNVKGTNRVVASWWRVFEEFY
jgi:hypothetical protein